MIRMIQQEKDLHLDFSGEDFILGQMFVGNFPKKSLPQNVRMSNVYPDDERDSFLKTFENWQHPSKESSKVGEITRIIFYDGAEYYSLICELANQWLESYSACIDS